MLNVPHNGEIERAVIGQVLFEPRLIAKGSLVPGDFYIEAYRGIFEKALGVYKSSGTVDLPLLSGVLSQDDLLLANKACSEAFSTDNFPVHVATLKDLAHKRRLQRICVKVAGEIRERDLNDCLLEIKGGLKEIIGSQAPGFVGAAQMAAEGWKLLEDRARHTGIGRIPCGLQKLDEFTDGFHAGDLTLIAARPSVGKTALALNFLLSAGLAGIAGGFISLEMGQDQIAQRILAQFSGVALSKVRKSNLSAEDWGAVSSASDILNGLPLFFQFGVRALKDVIAACIRLAEEREVRIIFLDYLQLVRADGAQNREREIALISGELKSLAASLKIPVIALSQLSRAPEKRDDRRPTISDLRDSGSLEQDADSIILLYREMADGRMGEDTELILGKGRNTGQRTFKAKFDGKTQRFYEGKEGTE